MWKSLRRNITMTPTPLCVGEMVAATDDANDDANDDNGYGGMANHIKYGLKHNVHTA